MPRYYKTKSIDRIIDANINRLKEGLRVCEEIARFVLNSHKLTTEFKKIRHQIHSLVNQFPYSLTDLLKVRESKKDFGRDIYIKELERKNLKDIFFANIQRIKESIRVLEEFTKIINKNLAVKFKKIRYDIYEIEKKSAKRISTLCNH